MWNLKKVTEKVELLETESKMWLSGTLGWRNRESLGKACKLVLGRSKELMYNMASIVDNTSLSN